MTKNMRGECILLKALVNYSKKKVLCDGIYIAFSSFIFTFQKWF